MKKYLYFFLFLGGNISLLLSCNPRIELDSKTWGDHAYIDNVQIIKLETDSVAKLWEYYATQKLVTGVRTITISNGNSVIDSAKATATITLKAGESLNYAAFQIYHKAIMVKPLNGSPICGAINNLTIKQFQYRLTSADGTERDWTIKIQ